MAKVWVQEGVMKGGQRGLNSLNFKSSVDVGKL